VTETSYRAVRRPLGHRAIEPMPGEDELRAYYAEKYFSNPDSACYAVEYPEDELTHRRLRAAVAMLAIHRHAGTGRSLLDVGCGEGFLLRAAVTAGFTVTGIDLTDTGLRRWHPELADRLRIGDAFSLLDAAVERGERFGVAVLQNVLEHVTDPAELLRRLHRLVDADGLLLVQVPNDFSALQLRALELGLVSREFWVAPPAHLHYFNTDTGPAFAAAHGFEVVDLFADFPIDWFLFHPGSNYVGVDQAIGRAAHTARRELDRLLAGRGIGPYLDFCRALAACGGGRNVAMVLRPAA
jgi:2-polyprenyl-3-methyl-5-hydroxy-6-metoxy-1,4-benzoquinol methylase